MKFAIKVLEGEAIQIERYIATCERAVKDWKEQPMLTYDKEYINRRIMENYHLMAIAEDKLRDVQKALELLRA